MPVEKTRVDFDPDSDAPPGRPQRSSGGLIADPFAVPDPKPPVPSKPTPVPEPEPARVPEEFVAPPPQPVEEPEEVVEVRTISGDGTVFKEENADPIVLNKVLNQAYGDTWIDWEPETIFKTIQMDFGAVPTVLNKNKIMAVSALRNSSTLLDSWDAFQNLCVTFSGRIPNFHFMQYISPAEICSTLSKVKRITDSLNPGSEVRGYIAVICMNEGLCFLPDSLRVAQDFLDSMGNDTELRDKIHQKLVSITDHQVMDPEDNTVELSEDPVDVGVAKALAIISASRNL
jgi:hypothetical protein